MVPIQLKDVSELLVPRWTPPHELAALSWLGDWRPSSILELIRSTICPSSSISSSSSSQSTSGGIERLLSQVIHEARIEEAIIDEEMSEIQATCILHLPFASLNKKQSGGSALGFIKEELKKIDRVINKAQQLRFSFIVIKMRTFNSFCYCLKSISYWLLNIFSISELCTGNIIYFFSWQSKPQIYIHINTLMNRNFNCSNDWKFMLLTVLWKTVWQIQDIGIGCEEGLEPNWRSEVLSGICWNSRCYPPSCWAVEIAKGFGNSASQGLRI